MDVNLTEGHAVVLIVAPTAGLLDRSILLVPIHEVASEHDHARHPEEQNLVCGDEQSGGIKDRLIARLLRPPQRCKRQQSRRKPGVEHVRNLLQLCTAALSTLRRSLERNDYFLAAVTRPCRDAMPPP